MIFWLVSPLSSCVLLPSYGHLGNKENHPASASTGSHPETLTDWSFPAPFIPYYAGSGLAGTKSRTHRGLGPHLFLFRSLFFFPSPSRCRTLEYGGFNPRYGTIVYKYNAALPNPIFQILGLAPLSISLGMAQEQVRPEKIPGRKACYTK